MSHPSHRSKSSATWCCRLVAVLAVGIYFPPAVAWSQEEEPEAEPETEVASDESELADESFEPDDGLLDLSIEELLQIEVTSVSKRQERLFTAPAAISVLTEEDIRRSGIQQLPELLRMIPGMHVGKTTASSWAVSARGFNGEFANKLQVLSDGRSLYTHLFSGVFWNTHLPLLADLERIEVIRGPGATLWGANAVNGVINIISKEARDTQGGYAEAGSGSELLGFSAVRWGDTLSDDIYYRVYANQLNHDSQEAVALPGDGEDDWQALQAGFRIDGYGERSSHFTVQGDLFGGKIGAQQAVPLLLPPTTILVEDRQDYVGGNLLARYSTSHGETTQSTVQFYYDRLQRESRITTDTRTDTFDLDYQLDWSPASSHDISLGFGYRAYLDEIEASQYIDIHRRSRYTHLLGAFVQDRIQVVPEALELTLGTKVEHQPYTGLEVQPNVRLAYYPSENHTLWGSVARAARSPSRFEDEGRIRVASFVDPGTGLPTEVTVFGNKDFGSEHLTAYELGYRLRIDDGLSFDVATFLNDYEHLSTIESGPALLTSAGTVVLTQPFDNLQTARAYGGEVESRWQVTSRWQLIGTYAFFKMLNRPDSRPRLLPVEDPDDSAPRNQATLRSQLDLGENVELDTFLSYVDVLSGQAAPAYLRADLRLGWHPTETLELSLVGQNLLDRSHPEFGGDIGLVQTEVERAVFFKVALRF